VGAKVVQKSEKNKSLFGFFRMQPTFMRFLPRKGTTFLEKNIKDAIKFRIFLWYFEKYE